MQQPGWPIDREKPGGGIPFRHLFFFALFSTIRFWRAVEPWSIKDVLTVKPQDVRSIWIFRESEREAHFSLPKGGMISIKKGR